MSLLATHFLDVVRGLPTLRAFNRGEAQIERIERSGDDYRTATMGTLRLAFLSGTVLELAATLGVALVAVTVGVRLVEGGIAFEPALTVLVLAPELYLPLRNLAAGFHASADGIAVADRLLGLIEAPVVVPAARSCHRACGRPRSGSTGSRSPTRIDRRPPSRMSSSSSRPARPSRSSGTAVAARAPWHRSCSAFASLRTDESSSTVSTWRSAIRRHGAPRSPGCRRARPCSVARSPTTSGSPPQKHPMSRCGSPHDLPARTHSSRNFGRLRDARRRRPPSVVDR